MGPFRLAPLLTVPLLIVACTTAPAAPTTAPSAALSAAPTNVPTVAPSVTAVPTMEPTGQPTSASTAAPTAPPTAAPTTPPTAEPSPEPTGDGGNLDPSLSDAGIVVRVTLSDDSRGFERDSTYDIIAVSEDGSYCSFTFDGEDYQAVAYDLSTEVEQVQRISVTIPWDSIPEGDGDTRDVDGRVSFDFNSESFVGMTYTGDASQENEGASTIDVDRVGEKLTFTFDSTTWDDATFDGQLVCATL